MNIRTAAFLVLAVIFASTLTAAADDEFLIQPRVVTNLTPAKLFWHQWLFDDPMVVVKGEEIQLLFDSGFCGVAAACPYSGEVTLPTLPGGDYKVIYRYPPPWGLPDRVAGTLHVQDVTTFPIFPAGAPAAGADDFIQYTIPYRSHGSARIGQSGQALERDFHPEPHEEGLEDVSFTSSDGRTTTVARNAFVYSDDFCHDARIWERVLIPLPDSSTGLFGSKWETSLTVNVDRDLGDALYNTPSELCENLLWWNLPLSRGGSTAYMPIPRNMAHRIDIRLTVREVGRDNAPVELPVIREADWLTERSWIPVPKLRANQRATLRIYVDSPPPTEVLVNDRLVKTAATSPDGPQLATLDITANPVPQQLYANHATLYWAMVTVTDNQTQEVTVYPARKFGPR